MFRFARNIKNTDLFYKIGTFIKLFCHICYAVHNGAHSIYRTEGSFSEALGLLFLGGHHNCCCRAYGTADDHTAGNISCKA